MLNLFSWIGTGCNNVICEIQTTIIVILAFSLPFIPIAIGLVFIGYFIRKYWKARRTGDFRVAKKFKRIALVTVVTLALVYAIAVL